jgi:hypothetical protein
MLSAWMPPGTGKAGGGRAILRRGMSLRKLGCVASLCRRRVSFLAPFIVSRAIATIAAMAYCRGTTILRNTGALRRMA